MALIPIEQQFEAFNAFRENDVIGSDYSSVYIPELVHVRDLQGDNFDVWLQGMVQAREAIYEDRKDPESIERRVLGSVVGYCMDGSSMGYNLPGHMRDTEQLTSYGQIRDVDFVLASAFGFYEAPDVSVSLGDRDGYDAKVTRRHYRSDLVDDEWVEIDLLPSILDIDTTAIADIDDPDVFSNISLPGATGIDAVVQRQLIAQLSSLGRGYSSDGFDLLAGAPYYALSRRIVGDILGHENFSMPFYLRQYGETELRPIEELATKGVVDIDISHIHGDLEFLQADRREKLSFSGKGVVTGEPYRFTNPGDREMVPEGAVVFIDDEFGMDRVPESVFIGAAAIITRGYTGERGIRADYSGYDHMEIIGRALADQKENFVYFKVPHINPDSKEMKIWEQLRGSSLVTVASDGKDIKLGRN
jgi:hypothetical protein